MIDAIWTWCRRSLTIVWSRFLIVLGILATFIIPLLDAAGTINVAQLLPQQYAIYSPIVMALWTSLIGLVTEACRRRSLPKEGPP